MFKKLQEFWEIQKRKLFTINFHLEFLLCQYIAEPVVRYKHFSDEQLKTLSANDINSVKVYQNFMFHGKSVFNERLTIHYKWYSLCKQFLKFRFATTVTGSTLFWTINGKKMKFEIVKFETDRNNSRHMTIILKRIDPPENIYKNIEEIPNHLFEEIDNKEVYKKKFKEIMEEMDYIREELLYRLSELNHNEVTEEVNINLLPVHIQDNKISNTIEEEGDFVA